MLVAVTADALQRLDESGTPLGSAHRTSDLAAAVRSIEAEEQPRWVWSSTASVYPGLLAQGVRVRRCHDLALTDSLLAAFNGHWSPPLVEPAPASEETLFELEVAPTVAPGERLAAQLSSLASAREASPGFALLVAAESGAALAAAEMGHAGLPWRNDVHDALLEEQLGRRSTVGGRPERLQELADRIAEALDDPNLNPDSPEQLLRSLRRQGLVVSTTRARELEQLDHPAIPLVLQYKELARLHAAHGWGWQRQWVRGGRFHPEFVVGGVVSGRWASRGGGALQIPRAVRAAAVADPGWRLVVADARQLEPRVLAALSGDRGLSQAAAGGDLYAALADKSFGGDRAAAKVGLLSAMYGGSTPALATMKRDYPQALSMVEAAARAGERGESVRSVLGRTSPRPDPSWSAELGDTAALGRERARGRFTRNFIIQASAADWANVLLSSLRGSLASVEDAELVFFVHDEVVVHVPLAGAAEVEEAIVTAGVEATRLVFGETTVAMPLAVTTVVSYADAK